MAYNIQTNWVGMLKEWTDISTNRKVAYTFELTGEAHAPIYECVVVIKGAPGGTAVHRGSGTNKMMAKQACVVLSLLFSQNHFR
jgi:dsRNA-specific ribonuclease